MTEKYPENEKVKESYYRHVVNVWFNIGFASVKTYTCTTCDHFMTIMNAKCAENAPQPVIAHYEELLTEHQAVARQGMEIIIKFCGIRYDSEETLSLCFNLQQTFPTPKLTHGAAYYKRKMWTYYFCVTNIQTNASTMFV